MGILVAIVSGFAGGVFLRSLFFTDWWPVLFIVLIAALFYFVPRLLSVYSPAPFERESSSFLMGLGAIFCICIALGMVRAAIAVTPMQQSFAQNLHHKVSYTGVVIADPDVRDANQRIVVRVSNGEETTNMLIVAP